MLGFLEAPPANSHGPANPWPAHCHCGYPMPAVGCREDSDPRYITNSEDVKLRAFTTKVLSLEVAD